ncbi:MAG: hypothetical protein QOI75_1350, partial [Pseudonocardiales bacterium]|nr:hypothetical protein [Pseudonocardiales bacterium]
MSNQPEDRDRCVVVGAGPVGLVAALALARE